MNGETFDNELASPVQRGGALLLTGAMTAAVLAVGYFDPTRAGFFPVCPLYRLTGIACPGCGGTRAMHALLHGDVLTALDFNLMLPVFLFIFGYLFVSLALTAARGRGLGFELLRGRLLWAFLWAILIFTVLRNLPVYPFSVLYP